MLNVCMDIVIDVMMSCFAILYWRACLCIKMKKHLGMPETWYGSGLIFNMKKIRTKRCEGILIRRDIGSEKLKQILVSFISTHKTYHAFIKRKNRNVIWSTWKWHYSGPVIQLSFVAINKFDPLWELMQWRIKNILVKLNCWDVKKKMVLNLEVERNIFGFPRAWHAQILKYKVDGNKCLRWLVKTLGHSFPVELMARELRLDTSSTHSHRF